MRYTISAVAIAALVVLGANAGNAQTMPEQNDSATAAPSEPAIPLKPGQKRLSDFFAGDLQSSDARDIGEVEDVILEGNRIVSVLIRVEQDLGLGERSVMVPFESLRRDGDRIVVDMTADQVRSLPALEESSPQSEEPRR